MAAIEDREVQEPKKAKALTTGNSKVDPSVSPSRLAARAFMEGYPVPDLRGAHYLEINCGNAANLIAHASASPEVSFTGTSPDADVSVPLLANWAKLQNVTTGDLDLAQFESSLGRYEFIVANDVFSTASTAEQMALLLMSRKHLADDGVICIGLDLYPGWHIVENLRDALCFGLENQTDIAERLSTLRGRIADMINGIQTGKYPDRRRDLAELHRLSQAGDAEIYTLLLDPKRRACTIAEFLTMADAASLKPIGDVDPLKTNRAVLPATTRREATGADGLSALLTEIDKYANTRRRQVLLCHADREPVETGLSQMLDALFVSSTLFRTDKSLVGEALLQAASVTFDGPVKYQTSNVMEIVTLALMEQNKHFPVSAGRLVGHVATALRKAGMKDVETRRVGGTIAELCSKLLPTGAFVLHAKETHALNQMNDQPTLAPLALYQARHGETHLTSRAPHQVHVDDVARFVLSRFDGTQTMRQICEDVKNAVAKKELDIPKVGNTPEARAQSVVLRVLSHAVRSALTVA